LAPHQKGLDKKDELSALPIPFLVKFITKFRNVKGEQDGVEQH
jgi:hypothetical protein